MSRALVLFSGGADSTLALAWALNRGYVVSTLEFDYPGRPKAEVRAAARITRHMGVRDRVRIRLPLRLARARSTNDGYFPNRNLVFHSIAQAVAESRRADVVVAGHLNSDALRFPDAHPRFLRRIVALARSGRPNRRLIRALLPLARMDSQEKLRLGKRIDAPLATTWSCWRDHSSPCGRCEKCRERWVSGL